MTQGCYRAKSESAFEVGTRVVACRVVALTCGAHWHSIFANGSGPVGELGEAWS